MSTNSKPVYHIVLETVEGEWLDTVQVASQRPIHRLMTWARDVWPDYNLNIRRVA